jgi:hypothetical protein
VQEELGLDHRFAEGFVLFADVSAIDRREV